MSVLLLTGIGLGIGSLAGWLVERRPQFLSQSASLDVKSGSPYLPITFLGFIIGITFSFFSLRDGNYLTAEIICSVFLFSLLAIIAFFDLRHQLIPNRLIIIGIVGWACFVVANMIPVTTSLVAGSCVAGLLFLVRILGFLLYGKAGMGMGDVKLVFLMGLFLQWEIFWVLYLAIFTGALWAMTGIVFKKFDRKTRLSFAPFLWVGVSLSVFAFSFQQFLALWI